MFTCPRCGKEQNFEGLCKECEKAQLEHEADLEMHGLKLHMDELSNKSMREWCLEEAMKIVCKDRNGQYGSPENSFERIAKLWSAYLDKRINTVDVAMMMSLLKIARIKGSEYMSTDSFVDLAGYAACGLECREEINDSERSFSR